MALQHGNAQNMDSHMNFRMFSSDKEIIETAAHLKGLKPQTYARNKLLEIAKKDIIEMNLTNTLVLNQEEWNHFMTVMEAPVKINVNLRSAVKEFNKAMKSKK